MRRVVLFTMHYWPQTTSVAPFTTDLADYLAATGWQVTVLTTFPHYPQWEVAEAYRGRLFQHEQRGTIAILRGWVYVPHRPKVGITSTWKRILYDTTLATSGLPAALTLPPQDAIIAVCPPLQTGLAAMLLKRLWRAPVLYWIQDIVPDAAVSTGMMREGLTLKLGRKLEMLVYQGVDLIANISYGFAANLEAKGVPASRMRFLPNWANLTPFERPAQPGERAQTRARYGIAAHDFVVLHAGNVGAKQALEHVIRAMKLLEHHTDMHLLIIGAGNSLDAVQHEAARLKLQRVQFLPLTRTVEEYVDLLRAADVLLVHQARDVKDSLIPSKLLTYLPSERPVLAAVHSESEAARFIQKAACGVVIAPEQPERLARALANLKRIPAVRQAMGQAGGRFIRAQYDRVVLLQRFAAALEAMVTTYRGGAVARPAGGGPAGHTLQVQQAKR